MKKIHPLTTNLSYLAIGIFFFLAFILLNTPIFLVTADLGRHLKNGKIAAEIGHPIDTNYYSYSEPAHPTINHHWLSGVLFWKLYQIGGFKGLSLFYSGLLWLSVLIYFIAAWRVSHPITALFWTLLAFPLIGDRLMIRPEGLTTFFLGMEFWLLLEFSRGKIQSHWLWLFPFIHIAWINLHSFFILGLFIQSVFLLDHLINKNYGRAKLLGMVFLGSLLASCCNPHGLKTVLLPFQILKEYGYRLAENQTVFFMQNRFADPLYANVEMLWAIGAILSGWAIWKGGWKKNFLPVVLLIAFGIFSFRAVRNLAIFGFVLIPILSLICSNISEKVSAGIHRGAQIGGLLVISGLLAISIFSKTAYFSVYKSLNSPIIFSKKELEIGWWHALTREPQRIIGLAPGINSSAEFFKRFGLKGPIFNNYDIGGYLIFHLFPQERVFVDNRPEAYSVKFFTEVYVPMQEDDAVWRKLDTEYGFNCIYFYRLDQTPWAQSFLIRRVFDPAWAPVYVDKFTIIFLKRNAENASLIQQFEIPRSLFNTVHPKDPRPPTFFLKPYRPPLR